MFIEYPRNSAVLLSESNGSFSRDQITLLTSPLVYAAGTVLKFAGGKYSRAAAADTAVAVLLNRIDATAADAQGVALTRDAELVADEIVYDVSVDDEPKKLVKIAQLKAVGLIVR